jgi:hypothetical protein
MALQNAEHPSIASVPDAAVLAILHRTDFKTLLSALLSSKRLRSLGKALVRAVRLASARVPAAIWELYPGATQLYIQLSSPITNAEALQRLIHDLEASLSSLPARLRRITLQRALGPTGPSRFRTLPDDVVATLLASPCRSSLEHLQLDFTCATAWQLLAGLPALTSAVLGSLDIPDGASPLPAITSLTTAGPAAYLALPRAAPPGLLSTLLPALQELTVADFPDSLYELATALKSHPSLERFIVTGNCELEGCWTSALLSSMPRLRHVALHCYLLTDGAGLLHDLAACGGLEALEVTGAAPGQGSETVFAEDPEAAAMSEWEGVTPCDLRVLADHSAACWGSLRRVVLGRAGEEGGRVCVSSVALLLRAGLPRLEELRAAVDVMLDHHHMRRAEDGAEGDDAEAAELSELLVESVPFTKDLVEVVAGETGSGAGQWAEACPGESPGAYACRMREWLERAVVEAGGHVAVVIEVGGCAVHVELCSAEVAEL